MTSPCNQCLETGGRANQVRSCVGTGAGSPTVCVPRRSRHIWPAVRVVVAVASAVVIITVVAAVVVVAAVTFVIIIVFVGVVVIVVFAV